MTRRKWRDRPRCRWCNNWFTRARPRQVLCSDKCRRLEGLARHMGLTRRVVDAALLVENAAALFTAGFWSGVRKDLEAGDEAARAFVLGDEFGAWIDVTAIDKDDVLRERLLARWNAGGTEE